LIKNAEASGTLIDDSYSKGKLQAASVKTNKKALA